MNKNRFNKINSILVYPIFVVALGITKDHAQRGLFFLLFIMYSTFTIYYILRGETINTRIKLQIFSTIMVFVACFVAYILHSLLGSLIIFTIALLIFVISLFFSKAELENKK